MTHESPSTPVTERERPPHRGIVHSRLDTSTLPPENRFTLFQAAVNATHDTVRIEGDERPFHAKLEGWLLHDMVITAGEQMAFRMMRTTDRLRADGFDHFTFTCLLRGEVTGVAGQALHYKAQEVAVLDLTEPMDILIGDNDNICVRLSRAAMRAALHPLPDLHGKVLTGLAGRLVSDHFVALLRYAPTMMEADIPLVSGATAALLASCLRQSDAAVDRDSPRVQFVRNRARQFIEDNLALPDLGPALLCRAINVSRSTLYRAFDGSAGIAGYIRVRRLERAYAVIQDAANRMTLNQVARSCGFVSEAHFSSAFRTQFGCRPKDVLLGKPCPDGGRLTLAYRRWLLGLEQMSEDEGA